MNHRERVVAALNHQETDRVPIDLGSTIVTTATLGRGGYVSCAAHNPQPDITPDRIEVMYQAALAHGAVAA